MSKTTHNRPARVAEQVQQVIAMRLAEGLKDPTMAGIFVTVTEVKMSPDLREARVYFSVFGDEQQKRLAKAALGKAKGYFKREIAHGIKLRLTPELFFHYDETVEGADKLDRLIREVKEREGW